MRIVWVTYDFGEYSLQQVAALGIEHDVLLVIPRHVWQPIATKLPPRVQVYEFDCPRLRQPWRQFRSVRAIHHRIREFVADVMHMQHGHFWFNLGLWRLRDVPLVVTIHDPRHHAGDAVSRKTPQWIMDLGFRRADQAIVHGQSLVAEVERAVGLPSERVHVMPHVAIGEVPSLPEATPPAAESDEPVVLFFGRIWAYKGLDYLIAAEPLISSRIPDVTIVIAGQGEELDRYRRQMRNPDRFEIHNHWIGELERARLFRRSAVVVLPYTEATQSGVVPVAYTFGKPVVATSVGGLPDCVEHGRTGLLVPPRDAKALADAIVSLLADSERRHEMGAQGRARQARESNPAVIADALLDVYRQAIAVHRPRHHPRPSSQREPAPETSSQTEPSHAP